MMKNSNKLIATLLISAFCTFNLFAQAQSTESENRKFRGKVEMIKVEDENGEVSKTRQEFDFDTQEELNEFLREKGISEDLIVKPGRLTDKASSKVVRLTKEESDDSGNGKMFIMRIKDSTKIDFDFDLEDQGDYKFEFKYTGADSLKGDFEVHELFMGDSIQVKIMNKLSGEANSAVFEGINTFVVLHRVDEDDKDQESAIGSPALRITKVKDMPVEDLSIYPNPAKGAFTTEFNVLEASDVVLSITDTKGAKVYSKELPNFQGRYKEQVDANDFDSGLYFFNLQIGEKRETHKIIVQ